MSAFIESYLIVITGLLLVTLLLGLIRIIKGPSSADRMLAAQLFGTVGVAVLALLAIIQQHSALLDAALVLALLAPLTLIAFVKLMQNKNRETS